MTEDGTQNEVVVITGASAGVGRATAEAYARRGARIGLLARGEERLQQAKEEVERLGGEALAIKTDVAEYDQMEAAADAVEEAFGPIDIWVNNAMTSVFAEFTDVKPEEYRRVTDVVYHGQVYGTMAALKRMIPRDRGTIVLVGSALAYRGIPLQSAYCGAKHATLGMMDSIRSELMHRDSNIHITMVQLPAINTPQFSWVRSRLPKKAQPVPPIFQPEVAADAVLFAANARRREVYVGGSTVRAIVGNKLSSTLGDWFLSRNGFEDQQRDVPEEEGRPDNLFDPAPGDFGAHGEFDDRSVNYSLQFWANKNKWWLLAGASLAGLLSGLLVGKQK